MSFWLALWVFSAPTQGAAGGSGCPLALAAPPPLQNGARVELALDQGVLRLTLLDRGGRLLAQRQVAVDGSCAAASEVAAAVIAAWDADLPAEPLAAPALPAVAALPPPPLPKSAAIAPARGEGEGLALERAPPARPRWQLGVGLLAGGTLEAAPSVGAGLLSVSLTRPGAHLGLELVLAAELPHALAIDGGSCRWQRLTAGLGPQWQLSSGRFKLEVAAEAFLSDLQATGQGLPVNRTDSALEPGLGLSARGAVRFGAFEPFVGLWPLWWLRPQVVAVEGTTLSAALPRVELLGGAGLRAWL